MPDAPVEITVAVPVKDRREQMERCLRALLEQDHASYEVLVLDNESTDGTAEACRALASTGQVNVHVEVVPGTVGAVRNRGGRIARGEFIAFTDSDCVADRSWLTAMAGALRSRERLGVVCGETRPQEPIIQGWPATIEVDRWTGRFESCNVAFRTSAFRESDGFDEEVGHFWEDTAAGYAVLRHGWDAAFVPGALVYHDVTYPGFRWHLKRAMKAKNLGPVVARYPEIADDLFWRSTFLHQRDAELLLAAVGLALTVSLRRPEPMALGLPYANERLRHWRDPKGLVQTVVYDSACLIGCLRASVAARRLIL